MELLQQDEFKDTTYFNGKLKPILIIRTDGGPDENVRYNKVVRSYIRIFKDFDLDGLYAIMMPPGYSAYNPVERRMAPLSRDLSGIILNHEHHGSHLDQNGKTVDIEKEKLNFRHAGETLASIWNQSSIDNFTVLASWKDAVEEKLLENEFPEIDYQWFAKHASWGYYCLQLVKCDNLNCCTQLRSPLKNILSQKFLPIPKLIRHENGYIKLVQPLNENVKKYHYTDLLLSQTLKYNDKKFCIDKFNPQFTQKEIESKICNICKSYFPTKSTMLSHRRALHKYQHGNSVEFLTDNLEKFNINQEFKVHGIEKIINQRNDEYLVVFNDNHVEWISGFDVDHELVKQYREECKKGLPPLDILIVNNIRDWLQTPWVDDNVIDC